jgi:NADH-quinone oxidoreductase subunit E
MKLPEQLEAKFQTLANRYPIKRSALIPMLLYGQDVFGFVSDELVAEIAGRLDLNTLQVTETMEYYSMLRRKPAGKYHVQVCTNVSCMLRGGNKILEHVERKLEIGHKEVTKDGIFSLEEVECIGACTGAPAMQVNYDFYENLTPETLDQIIDGLDHGRTSAPRRRSAGNQPAIRNSELE